VGHLGLTLKHPFYAHFLVLIATLLVAGSFIASQQLVHTINPISLTLLRFICASLVLGPFVLSRKKWRLGLLSMFPKTMIISLFFSGFFIALFESLKYTSTLNTGTLYTLVPLVTACLCLIIFKQPIDKKRLLAYGLGAIGTCWVIFKADINALLMFELNKGDLIFLAGSFSMCLYSVSMKYLYRGEEMIPLVFCTILGGVVWVSLALLISGEPLEWQNLNVALMGAMAYLVIGATVVTMYLYQKATVELGPNKVMAYSFLNPACLAILLFIFEDIKLEAIILPGIVISLFATLVLQINAQPKQ
jgi:drug/metabolite transporter (DMT)-like permease